MAIDNRFNFGVLGDAFYDVYHVGKIRGVSAEAPIPIIDIRETYTLPGGAGNVTQNISQLGYEAFFLEQPTQNYPTKNRLMTEDGVQLARWDENDYCRPYEKADLVGLLDADAIIVSDYGKGSISDEIVDVLRDVSCPIFVDTKKDPRQWIGSDAILFPNWQEYNQYRESYNWLPNVILKKGKEGITWLQFGNPVVQRPAKARYVSSVNGAGDTVIAAFAVAALEGGDPIKCIEFANYTAGLVVEQEFLKRSVTLGQVMDRIENEEAKSFDDYPDKGAYSVVSRFGLYDRMESMSGEEDFESGATSGRCDQSSCSAPKSITAGVSGFKGVSNPNSPSIDKSWN